MVEQIFPQRFTYTLPVASNSRFHLGVPGLNRSEFPVAACCAAFHPQVNTGEIVTFTNKAQVSLSFSPDYSQVHTI